MGLGRSDHASKHFELQCRRIDLDPSANSDDALLSLIEEIRWRDEEDQIAYRQATRHVSRLVHSPAPVQATSPPRFAR